MDFPGAVSCSACKTCCHRPAGAGSAGCHPGGPPWVYEILRWITLSPLVALLSMLALKGVWTPSDPPPSPDAMLPTHNNAYASMLYVGTPRDYEYFVGLRVMLASLRKTRPQADLVVVSSADAPQSWLDILTSQGIHVIPFPNIPNPYSRQPKFDARFIHALNKLYVWQLTQYHRVVMLDSDNLFLRNTDELFLCGKFCAVFIDPCTFHTGLFVLQPSNKTFADMASKLGSMHSRDGADQGFLTAYYKGMLKSPLFAPPLPEEPHDGPMYRLPMGYQMDAVFYYLRHKWRIMCSEQSVITFPGLSQFKPWYWYSWPLFNLALFWHERRRELIGYREDVTPTLVVALVWTVLAFISFTILSWRVHTQQHPGPPKLPIGDVSPRRARTSKRSTFGHLRLPRSLTKVASIVGIGVAFAIPGQLVPITLHPVAAWLLYTQGVAALFGVLLVLLPLPLAALAPLAIWAAGLCIVALPVYANLFQKVVVLVVCAFCLGPSLLWTVQRISRHIDSVAQVKRMKT